jgi:GNAT superfamily N-acetyltransferase
LFDCSNDDLNEFFQKDALAHKQELLVETYCLSFKNVSVALVSFSNDKIELSFSKRKKILSPQKARYKSLPAVKIVRLGVHKTFQKLGVGSQLINLCKKLFVINNRTGCRFITVDAYNNKKVLRFYKKNGFDFLNEKDLNTKKRTMYCDLKPYYCFH